MIPRKLPTQPPQRKLTMEPVRVTNNVAKRGNNLIPKIPKPQPTTQATYQNPNPQNAVMGGAQNNAISAQMQAVNAPYQGGGSQNQAANPPPPAAATPPPPAGATGQAGGQPAGPTVNDIASKLFPGGERISTDADFMKRITPGTSSFDPNRYQATDIYKYRLQQGQKDLSEFLNSRGLRNSGAEVEANSDLINKLGVEEALRFSDIDQREADRLYSLRNNEADRMTNVGQNEADRYRGMQEYESARRERGENNQWDRQFAVTNMGLGQNPAGIAAGGVDSLANLTVDQGRQLASWISKNFPQAFGGGGGGPAPLPPFAAPFPDSPPPNAGIPGINAGANQSWADIITGGLNALNGLGG